MRKRALLASTVLLAVSGLRQTEGAHRLAAPLTATAEEIKEIFHEVDGMEFGDGPTIRRCRAHLLAIGEPAVPYLIQTFSRQKDHIRYEAIHTVVEVGWVSVPYLIDELENEDPRVREGAIIALIDITGLSFGYNRAEGAAERQASIQQWHEWWAKEGKMRMERMRHQPPGEASHAGHEQPLAEATRPPAARQEASEAASHTQPVPPAASGSRTGVVPLPPQAFRADYAHRITELLQGLEKGGPSEEFRARRELAQLPEEAAPDMKHAFEDPQWSPRSRAALLYGLSEIPGPAVEAVLEEGLADPHYLVRLEAARGLGKAPSTASVDLLVRALKDGNGNVRGAAAWALGQLAPEPGSEAVPELIGLLQDPIFEVRTWAAQALGAIGDPRAVEPLKAQLAVPDPRLQAEAAESLRRLTGTNKF
jgi:HEAT repeat protein